MHHFDYRGGQLHCEEVSLQRIAAEVGTPVYIYSERTLRRHVRVFEEAFQAIPHLTCYAVKANSNIHILRRFSEWGTGFEIVSGGELFRVLKAAGTAAKVIFDGPGKTADEIRYALESEILFLNVESGAEADLAAETARRLGKRARISIRTNPNVDPMTHPYISTGMKKHKFGVAIPEARALYLRLRDVPEIDLVGVTCHMGSQITQMGPFVEALDGITELAADLKNDGIPLQFLDFGGGLGIAYNGEEPPSPASYAAAIIHATRNLGLTVILEPGRVIVGNAGILLARVVGRKNQGEKRFVIVDAGMNDLIRPPLYGSHHNIWPVQEERVSKGSFEIADVVGPICESADFIAQDRDLPVFEPGDLMAVMSAGAYGYSLSSNYNSRPRVAEVLVSGDTYEVIGRRETYDDLIRLETRPGA